MRITSTDKTSLKHVRKKPDYLDRLKELELLINEYLKEMDVINPGTSTIFKNDESKVGLETKVWNFVHKISACQYHYNNIKKISRDTLDHFEDFLEQESSQNNDKSESIHTLIEENHDILFEVDGFFIAARSSLDFIGCILSRYIKGKDTDKIRDCVKWFNKGKSDDALVSLIIEMWTEWGERLISYRDYLTHSGTLNPPKTIATFIYQTKGADIELESILDKVKSTIKQGDCIVFPLPLEAKRDLKITRMIQWFKNEEMDTPEGFSKDERTFTIGTGENMVQRRTINYSLDPRYIQAEDLCLLYLEKLIKFSQQFFGILISHGFTHINFTKID